MTPNANKNAAKIEAAREIAKTFGTAIEIPPADALLLLNHVSAGAVRWLQERIGELPEEELATPRGDALVRLWTDERDRLARVAKACVDSGLEVKQIAGQRVDATELALRLAELFEAQKALMRFERPEDENAWDEAMLKWTDSFLDPEVTRFAFKQVRQEMMRDRFEREGLQGEYKRREDEAKRLGFYELDRWKPSEGPSSGYRERQAFLDSHGWSKLLPYDWDKFVNDELAMRRAIAEAAGAEVVSGEVVD